MASSTPPPIEQGSVTMVNPARRIESSHTHMGIKRDESEDLTRKKKGQGHSNAHAIPWDDETDVSVQALHGFLEDLLGIAHAPLTNLPADTMSRQSSAITNNPSARAAHAYQTTGRAVHDHNVETQQPSASATASATLPIPAAENSALKGDFSEADKEKIRGFILRLTELQHRGIETLSLQRNLGFLDSIETAIAAQS